MEGTFRVDCSALIRISILAQSLKNFVAQELYAHGFSEAQQHSLYYFNSKKQGELDFVVEFAGNMLPIEVKSGKDYERHNALSNVMENEDYAVPMAYVLLFTIPST